MSTPDITKIVPSADRADPPSRHDAIEAVLSTLDGYTLHDIGPHLTCTEAEVLCEFFAAHGQHAQADALRKGHVYGDDDVDDDDHTGQHRTPLPTNDVDKLNDWLKEN